MLFFVKGQLALMMNSYFSVGFKSVFLPSGYSNRICNNPQL